MAITKVTNRVLEIDSVGTAQLSAGAITEAKIASSAITNAKLATEVQQLLVPVGAVMAFARNTAPTGWLICDGSALSRTVSNNAYQPLHTAIGYAFGGSGDTFNIPDLRGIFVRGSGQQTFNAVTYGTNFAQKQSDAFQHHWHRFYYIQGSRGTTGPSGGIDVVTSDTFPSNNWLDSRVRETITPFNSRTPALDFETRPVNISLLYCIKWN